MHFPLYVFSYCFSIFFHDFSLLSKVNNNSKEFKYHTQKPLPTLILLHIVQRFDLSSCFRISNEQYKPSLTGFFFLGANDPPYCRLLVRGRHGLEKIPRVFICSEFFYFGSAEGNMFSFK